MSEKNQEDHQTIPTITKFDNKLNCLVYKTTKTSIANISVPKFENSFPYLIFIIDKSGSMYRYFTSIINTHIPNFLKSLKYPPEKKCNLITFENHVSSSLLSTDDFVNSNLSAWGCTFMANVFSELEKTFEKLKKENERMIRILAISDGEIHDQRQTKVEGDKLYKKFEGQFKINAQAIRLKTSKYANPDTEALSSILQFSDFDSKVIDINEDEFSSLSEKTAELFKDDNLCGGELALVSDKSNLKLYPWQKTVSKVQLNPDLNTVFIENEDEVQNLAIQRNDEKCNLNIKTLSNEKVKFENIVAPNVLTVIEQKIKLNKVINTPQTLEENKNIINVISEFNDNNSKNNENVKENEDNYFDSLEKIENAEQKNISKLNNDRKATYINTKRDYKKINELFFNKNTIEEMKREKESKLIMLNELKSALAIFKNSQNTKSFSDFSNPNIEEDIKKESQEKTEMMEKVMNSLTQINLDLKANFSEIADEKIKENIEKEKKEFDEKIGDIVSNLKKLEFDLSADFSQIKNKNIVEMIEKEKEERQKIMNEKIENLKKINADLNIDFCDFRNEFIVEIMKKEKEEQLKVVNDVKENLKQGDGINDGTTDFCEFENLNIIEDIRKENEIKNERMSSARNSLTTTGIKDWKDKDMSKFENKNITEQNQQKKEMEKKQWNDLFGGLKRRNTINLTANFSDLISPNAKKEEPKLNVVLKKTGVNLKADFSSYSTKSKKEDEKEETKENIFKIALKKVPTQSESSSRRESIGSEDFLAQMKSKLKPTGRRNTMV